MKRMTIFAVGILPLLAVATGGPAVAVATEGRAARSVSSSAPAADKAANEAFRSQLRTYLSQLQGAVDDSAKHALAHGKSGLHAKDSTAALKTALAQLPKLDAAQLTAMRGLLSKDQSWRSKPDGLRRALASGTSATSTPAPTLTSTSGKTQTAVQPLTVIANPPGFLSSCGSGVGDQVGLFYGYWVAAQIASAANAVASGMPDGVDFTPALIIAAVIFGVANGIAIGLQADLSIAQDCATAVANATATESFAKDDNGDITPGSSQISINTLTTLIGGVQAALDSIQTSVNVTTITLQGVITSLGNAQGTANAILVITKDLQDRADALLTSVGLPTATDTSANGLANTINTRADTILANTAAFQALSVRAEIERSLAGPPLPSVGLFALPASQGGYLETVRDIVALTINKELLAGQPIYTAQSQFSTANAALVAGQYASAYVGFSQAYQTAVK